MRVVLDTNILLSGLMRRDRAPGLLIEAWRDGRFTLVSHAIQLDEFRDVSRRVKIRSRVRSFQAGRLLNQIAAFAEMPVGLPQVVRSPDPLDDFLLALCEAGRVDRLVTGDKSGLLVLGRHGGAQIVTAAALAGELKV